ncbi:MAG: RNA pyrophosphohydrolase [Hyphomicrobium sp.]
MTKNKHPVTDLDLSKLGYRPCVGLMVINRHGLVWIGCRADAKNEAEGRGAWWQMPQGGIDPDESPREAALRELYEETGMRSVEFIAEHPDWINYDLPRDLLGKAWGGRYRGQKQKWFAFRFTGDDREVNIAPPGHPVEFVDWRWAPLADVLHLIVPFKRAVYDAVLAEFGPLARTES